VPVQAQFLGHVPTWFVLKAPVKIVDKDIAALGKIYPMNARPTHPLNGRELKVTK
jgi:carbonic anhydrase